jgi:hypothetical protein
MQSEELRAALLRSDVQKAHGAKDIPLKGKKKVDKLIEKMRSCTNPETSPTKKKTHSMGMPKQVKDPQTIFVREFRWTLSSPTLEEYWCKNVSFDWKNNTIYFEAYEVVCDGKINILDWVENLNPEGDILEFATYDGCGNEIYIYDFTQVRLVGRNSCFDYATSEAATQKITLTFGDCSRRMPPEIESKKEEDYVWRAIAYIDNDDKTNFSCSDQVEVKLVSRPTVDIEEVEVDFLNEKTFIPGKARWRDLVVVMNESAKRAILPKMLAFNKAKFSITLYDGEKHLETWTLKNSWVQKVSSNRQTIQGVAKDEYEVVFTYSDVEYTHHDQKEKK